jgi:hypothetical protein
MPAFAARARCDTPLRHHSTITSASHAQEKLFACLLQLRFELGKYCARTNPTWRNENGSEEKGEEGSG